MEKTLKVLFDFQNFSGNPRLAKIISETEKRYCGTLSDDDLKNLSAAGELFPSEKTEDKFND